MKKILSLLASVAVLYVISTVYVVHAENNVDCNIKNLSAQKTELMITIEQNQGDDFRPIAEKSSLFFGKQECNIIKIENLIEADIGVVYDCIVDISGSMDQERINKSKELLNELVRQKKEQDVLRITCMGNEKISSEYMTDIQKINDAIDAITLTNEDTNLYYSLNQELTELQTNNALPDRRCVIIFSDGAEDQKKGITLDEVLHTVTECKIPVFTVAMLKANATDLQLESAKIFGQLSRSSYGGIHFAPVVDQWEYEDVIPKISAVCNDSLIVTADFSGLQLQSDTASIELVLSSDDYVGTIQSDIDSEMTMTLILNGNSQKAESTSQESVSDDTLQANEEVITEEVKTDEATVDEDIVLNPKMLVIVVIVVALVIVITIIILVSSSGRKKTKPKYVHSFKKIVLTRQSDGEEIKVKIKKEIILGRSETCDISIIDDPGMSEKHCIFIYENGNIYVKDNNSTNGTYVNGIPQINMCMLNQGDILLIGSAEYAVTWQ